MQKEKEDYNLIDVSDMSKPTRRQSSSPSVEFDDVFQMVNSFGTYQKTLYFGCCLIVFFTSFPFATMVFRFATPPFQCSTPNVTCPQSTCCDNCTSYSFDKSFTSTVTEWNLICGREYLNAAIQTCMYVGMLVSAPVSGIVTDVFGRKKSIFIFYGIIITAGFASSFSNSVALMGFLWFFIGIGTLGTFISLFTYSMEMNGPDVRTMTGTVLNITFDASNLVFVFLAYFIRDWRIFLMVITGPGFLLYAFWRVFPGSPRWLVAHDHFEEACSILLKYGGRKNEAIDKERLKNLLADVRRLQIEKQKDTKASDPRMLCRTPKLRKWSAALGFIWFCTAFIGNALFLYIHNLSGNMYLNFSIMMFISLGQFPIVWFVLKKFGRRIPHTVLLVLVGVLCLLVLAIPNEYPMVKSGLILAAAGITSGLWNAIYIRTSEINPTVVRATAQGTGSLIGRVIAIAAPFFVILGRIPGIGMTLPMVVFGVVSLAAGVVSMILPETLFAPMHQTIEEAEAAKEDFGIPCCGRPGNEPVESKVLVIDNKNSEERL